MNRRDFLLSVAAATMAPALPALAESGWTKVYSGSIPVRSLGDELQAARIAVEDAVARSIAGDVKAIPTVAPLTARYTTLAYQYYGSTEDYVRIFTQAQNSIHEIAASLSA